MSWLDYENMMICHEYLENGLIPDLVYIQGSGSSLVRKLNSLSLEDQRIIKRKFRKVWRKELKNSIREAAVVNYKKDGTAPTPSQRIKRRKLVNDAIYRICAERHQGES